MPVQCHYKYNRLGEYKKTEDDKQACICTVIISPSKLIYMDLRNSSSNSNFPKEKNPFD